MILLKIQAYRFLLVCLFVPYIYIQRENAARGIILASQIRNNMVKFYFGTDPSQRTTVRSFRKRARKHTVEKASDTVVRVAAAAKDSVVEPRTTSHGSAAAQLASSGPQSQTIFQLNNIQLPVFAINASSEKLYDYFTFHRHKWQLQRRHKTDARQCEKLQAQPPKLFRIARLFVNEANCDEHDCGPMAFLCKHCSAKHFESESVNNHFPSCSHDGKVKLDEARQMRSAPEFLEHLLTSDTAEARNFRVNIRKFNNAFAFASMRANIQDVFPGRGPDAFKIHGQVYHSISDAHPKEGSQRTCSQLYIIDSGQALSERLNRAENADCNAAVFDKLNEFYHTRNPIAASYFHMRQREMQEIEDAKIQRRPLQTIKMMFTKTTMDDCRRYNKPNSDEIAAIFVAEDGAPPGNIDFVVYPNSSSGFQVLKQTSEYIDPMTYPILFPMGELGWSTNLSHSRRTKCRNTITQLQYFCFRIAVRE